MKKRRMSWGIRLALNLVLLCVLVVFIWGLLGFSSPTLRGRFRRVAQANWADPLEIQGVLLCDGRRWVLAAGQDQVILWQDGRDGLEYWPRDPNGTTLVPVPEMRTAQGEIWVAAADVPEGTAAAGLELTVGCWYQKNGTSGWSFSSQPEQPGDLPPLTQQWEKTYSAAGELLQDGAVLFHIAVEEGPDEGGPPEDLILSDTGEWDLYWSEPKRRGVDCAMEAVFYDAEGQELERAALATTEEGGGPWTAG